MLLSNGMAWVLYFIKTQMTIRCLFIKFVLKRTLIEWVTASLNEQDEAFNWSLGYLSLSFEWLVLWDICSESWQNKVSIEYLMWWVCHGLTLFYKKYIPPAVIPLSLSMPNIIPTSHMKRKLTRNHLKAPLWQNIALTHFYSFQTCVLTIESSNNSQPANMPNN